MAADDQYFTALFGKLLERKLTLEESKALVSWLADNDAISLPGQLIIEELCKPVAVSDISPKMTELLEQNLKLILKSKEVRGRVRFFRLGWTRYAAAGLFFLVCTSVFFAIKHPWKKMPVVTASGPVIDVPPGKQGAVLTLADGKKIILDSLGNGQIADQQKVRLTMNKGRLVYAAIGPAVGVETGEEIFNVLTTPRGRQFELTLPDGTLVWLDAESSLRYPARFTKTERTVEISGEAYFEVGKDVARPFRVITADGTRIEVLGTHFNINSYHDGKGTKTTLLEGGVRIVHGKHAAVLRPGEQAQVLLPSGNAKVLQDSAPIQILENVDTERVLAWKNGIFDFQDASLEEVMRQLERWYDIEVIYAKGIPQLEFVGKMRRDLGLQEVLRGLEMSKVKFRLEAGKKLIILP